MSSLKAPQSKSTSRSVSGNPSMCITRSKALRRTRPATLPLLLSANALRSSNLLVRAFALMVLMSFVKGALRALLLSLFCFGASFKDTSAQKSLYRKYVLGSSLLSPGPVALYVSSSTCSSAASRSSPAIASAERIWQQGTTPLRKRSKSRKTSFSLKQRFLDSALIFVKTSWQEMSARLERLDGAVCGLIVRGCSSCSSGGRCRDHGLAETAYRVGLRPFLGD
mmetsp:Transcript_34070/g.79419  ORF Transcript_34070/g.79419 Transcript_34070/m.79419 type:complete len:224 (-) Transcript_34070:1143-1814(-)